LKRENPKNENTEQAKIQISKTETQGGEKNQFRHWSVLCTEVTQFKPIKLKFVLKPHQPENSARDLPPALEQTNPQ
jgi:hypothetical protein